MPRAGRTQVVIVWVSLGAPQWYPPLGTSRMAWHLRGTLAQGLATVAVSVVTAPPGPRSFSDPHLFIIPNQLGPCGASPRFSGSTCRVTAADGPRLFVTIVPILFTPELPTPAARPQQPAPERAATRALHALHGAGMTPTQGRLKQCLPDAQSRRAHMPMPCRMLRVRMFRPESAQQSRSCPVGRYSATGERARGRVRAGDTRGQVRAGEGR